MRAGIRNRAIRWARRCAITLLVLPAVAQVAAAQDAPLVTGAIAFLSNTNGGRTSYDPTLMPEAVVPVTQRFVFETRGSFLEAINPRTGESDQTRLARNVAYLQMDYLANAHMTFVAGKFLTPFATYNERLSPIWIGNYQDGPLIVSLGTNGSTETGGEVKGSIFTNNLVNADYAVFYGTNVGGRQFSSSRATGGRINFYFPASGFEVGASYDHMFEGLHPNTAGVHVWWEPHNVPLTVRSEFAHSTNGQGYWIETGYRLSRFGGAGSWIGRLEPLFRIQQSFREHADSTDGLPSVNEQRADFGLDYYLPHEVRINTSYSRQFASTGNANVWKTTLVYRFAFPAWPGRAK